MTLTCFFVLYFIDFKHVWPFRTVCDLIGLNKKTNRFGCDLNPALQVWVSFGVKVSFLSTWCNTLRLTLNVFRGWWLITQVHHQFFEKHLQQIRWDSIVTVNLCKKIHLASCNVKKYELKHFSHSWGGGWWMLCDTDWTQRCDLLPSIHAFLFHLLSTNLAYTAHLGTCSMPHLLCCKISIVSSRICFLLLLFLS